MEHIGLFGILVVLIITAWVANYVYQIQKSYKYPFLKPLFEYTVYFSCGVLIGMVVLYVHLNVEKGLLESKYLVLQELSFLFVSLFELGLIYSIFRVYLGFRGRSVSRRLRNGFILGIAVFVFTYLLKIPFPKENALFKGVDRFHSYVFDNIVVLEILFLVLILLSPQKDADPNFVKLRKAFGWIFLSRYIIIIVLFVLFVLLIPNAGEQVPRGIRYPIALVLVLSISIVPFIWIKYFFLKYADSLLVLVKDREVLDSIFDKYGISKREQEILKLILEGKTNKEIEDKLFISYHTVKNHVYNLYQKLGVKNRYELVHLITTFQNKPAHSL